VTPLTPFGLIKILGQVTAIMMIPMVGGTVLGLVVDGIAGTSPLLTLIGLAIGTLISATGVALLIRSGMRKGYTGGDRGDGA
jgi:F0F1-type ATP synthase assembly protein I